MKCTDVKSKSCLVVFAGLVSGSQESILLELRCFVGYLTSSGSILKVFLGDSLGWHFLACASNLPSHIVLRTLVLFGTVTLSLNRVAVLPFSSPVYTRISRARLGSAATRSGSGLRWNGHITRYVHCSSRDGFNDLE